MDFDKLVGQCTIAAVEHTTEETIGVDFGSGVRGSHCWDVYTPTFRTEDPEFKGEYSLATERTQRSGRSVG